MGVTISMALSDGISGKEWTEVYEESLMLAQKLGLAEERAFEYGGIEFPCLAPVEERTWQGFMKEITGWMADGDMQTRLTFEEFRLTRGLFEGEGKKDWTDALMGTVPAYQVISWEDERANRSKEIWGGKTGGMPYHFGILAVACLIEDRLGRKAAVYGDITRGQCRKAVRMANKMLDRPVGMPAECDAERLFERVKDLPLSGAEKVHAFTAVYLGTKDAAFGEFLRSRFSSDDLMGFWEGRFKDLKVDTLRFGSYLKEYLTWGFGIAPLCRIADLTDDDGNPCAEEFVERIMESGLHLREKDTEDFLDTDMESEDAYGLDTQRLQRMVAAYVTNDAYYRHVRDLLDKEENDGEAHGSGSGTE